MAGVTNLIKSFFNDRGIDQRSSDLVREPQFASDLLNADYRKTGALNKRKGVQCKEEDFGGNGLGVYKNIDVTSGLITEELISVDDNLNKISEQSITITYTGTGVSRFSLFLDSSTSTFKATIVEDGVTVLDFDLGTGINELSLVTIGGLKIQIDALADYSAVVSGDDTKPAAFLDISRDITLNSSGVPISCLEFEIVNSPLSSPLAATLAAKNSSDFQNVSMVNLSNVLYVASGYDEMYKYDGQTFYRAGMPEAVDPTTADGGAGSVTNSSTKHIVTYVQKDNKGNIIEGIESDPSAGLNLTSKQIDVTVTNIEDDTGFNTNCAIVDGLQAGVTTIAVDDGSAGAHTFKVGDTAYFYDGVSSSYVEREITAIAANSITIAGAAVNVADNAVISNNLRIAIFRNKAAGSTYYLVAEIPNNSFTTTQVYVDNIADAALGAAYVVPVKPHGLPPKVRYLTVFQNLLIGLGGFTEPNTFYWSEIDSAEYFPSGDNQQLIETSRGDKITGGAVNNNALFIFKNQSIHTLTGTLFNDQFQVDEVAGGDVGCSSHHTIDEVQGRLVFLSSKGVFGLLLGDNEPEDISFIIEPIFDDIDVEYNFEKAISINWFQKDKYMLMLPAESTSTGGDLYTDTNNSKILVYDYSRKAWLVWNNLDFQSGIALYNDKLYLSERRLGTATGNVENYLYTVLDSGDTYDYADHTTAIPFTYKTHWEALKEPDVFKKFLRLKVQSLDASINDFESDTFIIDVETQLNYNDSPSSTFSLDFSSNSGWGEFSWGVDDWGSSRVLKLKSKLASAKAQSIRVIFTNDTIHENILISGWTLEAVFPYRIRIKE